MYYDDNSGQRQNPIPPPVQRRPYTQGYTPNSGPRPSSYTPPSSYTSNSGPYTPSRPPVQDPRLASLPRPAVTRDWEEERRQLRTTYNPPPKKRRGGFFRVVLLLLFVALIGGGTGYFVAQHTISDWESTLELAAPPEHAQPSPEVEPPETGTQQTVSTPQTPPPPPVEPGNQLSAEEIYLLGRQQVVGITAELAAQDAFGQGATSVVTGSGFILSEDGFILTNYHVIEGASRIFVILEDDRAFEAVLVGGENITSDIALLKIEATGLSAVSIGSSADMRVGSTIYAIGNPLGELTYTMTRGIVSSLNREVAIETGRTLSMFQIDAAVNSGNSGGPVYNAFGQVVGVVTAKSKLEGVEGIGFAIPIDAAMRYATQLMEHGSISRPHLGISPATLSPTYAYYHNLVPGVFVNHVYLGSAAERGGMIQGDVITAFNGRAIVSVEELRAALADYAPGDTVTITVHRNGEDVQLTVVLDERPTEAPAEEAQGE